MFLSTSQILALQQIPGLVENESMAKHTNYRIGGPARYYVVVSSSDELSRIVQLAEEKKIPWYAFGGGSNMIVSDKGYEGLMIQVANRNIELRGDEVVCEAGAMTAFVARQASEAGLAGFVWAVGVPGTIGGALFGNAGCYGGEMKDVVASVDAYRLSNRTRVTLSNTDCGFGYRESLFKHERYLILGCTLKLTHGDRDQLVAELNAINAKRRENQPLGESGAGCMFKNVEFLDEAELSKLKQKGDVPQAMLTAKRIGAGWLLDQAGLKGERIGQAQVSPTHANFIINLGGATSDEVAQLVSRCQTRVRDRFDLQLQTEIQFVG
jgi:UDP-N-acetylmuramate dehydrogenase